MRLCLLTGWFVVLCFASAASDVKLYRKLGGEVELEQKVSAHGSITSIEWKVGTDRAMLWEGQGKALRGFRQFIERGHLNTTTGTMTISGLIRNDSGQYTPEVNGKYGSKIHLEVISPVLVPTIKSCDSPESTCNLVCEGDTAGAGEVTYTWKADNNVVPGVSGNNYTINKDSINIKEFSCEVKNEVSRESSNPIPNPFSASPEKKPNIFIGIIVFICLLLPILLLALFHKWKTGVYFYQKASMPWEADFWQRGDTPQRGTDSNGSVHTPEEHANEETPMK